MQTTITILVITALAATLTSVAFARQAAPRTPTTVKEVMTTMTIPASDAIFAAAAEPPASAQAWVALRNSASTLAESGRLLMTSALAKDRTTWMEKARDLVNEAEATMRIADAKNREELEKAADSVYTTCKSCHARYMTASGQ
jgi:hypothetical protein